MLKQECIPAFHSRPGTPPGPDTPQIRHPLPGAGTPQEQAPPGPGTPSNQASPRRQTHACKHITLPQTSFASGNYSCPCTLPTYMRTACVHHHAGVVGCEKVPGIYLDIRKVSLCCAQLQYIYLITSYYTNVAQTLKFNATN